MTELGSGRERHWNKAWTLVAVVAGVAVIGLCVARVGNDEPTTVDLSVDAKRVCQDRFVPARLKAPATAKFSGVSVTNVGSTYTVSGSVDSQNAFGALVRASFSCVVLSEDDRWRLESAQVVG